MYTQQLNLKDNEIPAKINLETGELTEVKAKSSFIPDGYSRLNYKHFGMLNLDVTKKLENYFTNTELSVIFKMISRCDFNSNSLKPLNDDMSLRDLADEFGISKSSVPKVFSKLFSMGVYATFRITEDQEEQLYWILNPYIFWRGRLRNDAIFNHFNKTDIAKLLV